MSNKYKEYLYEEYFTKRTPDGFCIKKIRVPQRNETLILFIQIIIGYTAFIASTGSSREAESAGINPAKTPITPEMVNPRIILAIDKDMVISAAALKIRVPTKIRIRPITPPKSESTTASKIN